jgi:hypothetical protein
MLHFCVHTHTHTHTPQNLCELTILCCQHLFYQVLNTGQGLIRLSSARHPAMPLWPRKTVCLQDVTLHNIPVEPVEHVYCEIV